MKICAIISEFNPFHSGHKYLIDEIKKQGFTHIVAIMSGNFVERGEPAIVSKESRIKAALLNGIDLVIELPTVKVLNSAEKYAAAAVETAQKLGCIDALVFGSECGNTKTLEKASDILESQEFKLIFKKYISLGNSFPKSKFLALKDLTDDKDLISALKNPNNILGIEYIKALKKLKSNIKPITIKRTHDFLSSSEIRNLIINNNSEYKNYVPKLSAKLLVSDIKNDLLATLENADKPMLYSIKSADLKSILKISDVSEGLENRILSCAEKSFSVGELLKNIKTKRYTMARIKRILVLIFLKITKSMQNKKTPFIKVTGTTKKGLEILKKAKKTSKLPIVSRHQEIKKLGKKAFDFFKKECLVSEMYYFFTPNIQKDKNEKSFKIIKGEEFDV